MPPKSWYTDHRALAADHAYLQDVYARLRRDLGPAARRATRRVHAYPSRGCTYTLNKERVYVSVVDPTTGGRVPECILRHVLLHELAHVLNTTEHGHGARWRRLFAWLQRHAGVQHTLCPERVPAGFNPCH